MDAEIDQHADEKRRRRARPRIRLRTSFVPQRLSTSATAAATCWLAGGDADQPLDDRRRRRRWRCPARWPWPPSASAAMTFSASRDAGIELGVELLAARLRPRAASRSRGLVGERLGAAAGVRQRLLVGGDGRVGLVLEPLRLGEIAVDALAAAAPGSSRRAAARPATSGDRARRRRARARATGRRRSPSGTAETRRHARPRERAPPFRLLCVFLCHRDSEDHARHQAARVCVSRSQSANSSSSAISSEKMPSASVTAKPKIRLPNWPCAADGLRSAAAR